MIRNTATVLAEVVTGLKQTASTLSQDSVSPVIKRRRITFSIKTDIQYKFTLLLKKKITHGKKRNVTYISGFVTEIVKKKMISNTRHQIQPPGGGSSKKKKSNLRTDEIVEVMNKAEYSAPDTIDRWPLAEES